MKTGGTVCNILFGHCPCWSSWRWLLRTVVTFPPYQTGLGQVGYDRPLRNVSCFERERERGRRLSYASFHTFINELRDGSIERIMASSALHHWNCFFETQRYPCFGIALWKRKLNCSLCWLCDMKLAICRLPLPNAALTELVLGLTFFVLSFVNLSLENSCLIFVVLCSKLALFTYFIVNLIYFLFFKLIMIFEAVKENQTFDCDIVLFIVWFVIWNLGNNCTSCNFHVQCGHTIKIFFSYEIPSLYGFYNPD